MRVSVRTIIILWGAMSVVSSGLCSDEGFNWDCTPEMRGKLRHLRSQLFVANDNTVLRAVAGKSYEPSDLNFPERVKIPKIVRELRKGQLITYWESNQYYDNGLNPYGYSGVVEGWVYNRDNEVVLVIRDKKGITLNRPARLIGRVEQGEIPQELQYLMKGEPIATLDLKNGELHEGMLAGFNAKAELLLRRRNDQSPVKRIDASPGFIQVFALNEIPPERRKRVIEPLVRWTRQRLQFEARKAAILKEYKAATEVPRPVSEMKVIVSKYLAELSSLNQEFIKPHWVTVSEYTNLAKVAGSSISFGEERAFGKNFNKLLFEIKGDKYRFEEELNKMRKVEAAMLEIKNKKKVGTLDALLHPEKWTTRVKKFFGY